MTANSQNADATTGQMTLDGFNEPPLSVGDHVEDLERDASLPATMVVVGLSPKTADEFEFAEGMTVADANPAFPADDKVVEVVFPNSADLELDTDDKYAYPRSRLMLTESVHG